MMMWVRVSYHFSLEFCSFLSYWYFVMLFNWQWLNDPNNKILKIANRTKIATKHPRHHHSPPVQPRQPRTVHRHARNSGVTRKLRSLREGVSHVSKSTVNIDHAPVTGRENCCRKIQGYFEDVDYVCCENQLSQVYSPTRLRSMKGCWSCTSNSIVDITLVIGCGWENCCRESQG